MTFFYKKSCKSKHQKPQMDQFSILLTAADLGLHFRGWAKWIWGFGVVYIWGENIFPVGGFTSLWSRGFTIFQSRVAKRLLSNYKAVNTCEDKFSSL